MTSLSAAANREFGDCSADLALCCQTFAKSNRARHHSTRTCQAAHAFWLHSHDVLRVQLLVSTRHCATLGFLLYHHRLA